MLLALTILCTLLAFKVKFLPASLAAGSFWAGFLVTLLLDPEMADFGDITFLGTQFFVGGLVLWVFVPLLLQIRTDVTSEKTARKVVGGGGMPQNPRPLPARGQGHADDRLLPAGGLILRACRAVREGYCQRGPLHRDRSPLS